MGSRFNIRLIFAGLVVFLIAFGVFTVTQGAQKETIVYIATKPISAGNTLTQALFDAAFTPVTIKGDIAGGGALIVRNADVTADGRCGGVIGRTLTNSLSTGSVLQYSDLYLPIGIDGASAIDAGATASDPDAAKAAALNDPICASLTSDRLSSILKANERAIVLFGDPSSTFVRPGDMVDVYYLSSDGGVKLLFTKEVRYSFTTYVAGSNETPAGTAFVLTFDGADAAAQIQDLVFAQRTGEFRVAIVAPGSIGTTTDSETTYQSFADTWQVTIGGAVPNPLPVDPNASPSPSPSVDPNVTPSPDPSPSPSPTVPGQPTPTPAP